MQPKIFIQKLKLSLLKYRKVFLLLLYLILMVLIISLIKRLLPQTYQLWLSFQTHISYFLLSAYADAEISRPAALSFWLWKNGEPMIAIVPPCLIDRALACFLSFMLVFTPKSRFWWKYLLLGLFIMLTFNSLRIILLGELHLFKPSWYNYSHDFILPATEYLMVIVLWMGFVKFKNTNQNEPIKSS